MLIRRRQLCMTQKLFKKLLTSEDKRRELQEIPAAELQQFAINFVQSFCLCNFLKKKITRWLEEINFISSRWKTIFYKRAKPLENNINTFAPPYNILYTSRRFATVVVAMKRMAGMETRLKIYQPVVKWLCACDRVNVQSTGSSW